MSVACKYIRSSKEIKSELDELLHLNERELMNYIIQIN